MASAEPTLERRQAALEGGDPSDVAGATSGHVAGNPLHALFQTVEGTARLAALNRHNADEARQDFGRLVELIGHVTETPVRRVEATLQLPDATRPERNHRTARHR